MGAITFSGPRSTRWTTLAGTAASSYPASTFGLHPGVTYSANTDALSDQVAGTIRLHDSGVAWKYVETSAGVYDWSALDGHVTRQKDTLGRDIIFTIFGTPSFQSARPAEVGAYGAGWPGASAEPATDAAFTNFLSALATRYGSKIQYFEVWNEPVFDGSGASTSLMFTGTAAALARLVRLANQTIKAIVPTAKIITPPIPHTGVSGSFTTMMNASDGAAGTMKQWVDIVSYHAYQEVTANPHAAVGTMRAAADALGLTSAEIWETESNVTYDTAATWIDPDFIRWMKRHVVLSLWAGAKRHCLYGWDYGTRPTGLGIKGRPYLQVLRNAWLNQILANGLQDVARSADGRVYYRSGSLAEVV